MSVMATLLALAGMAPAVSLRPVEDFTSVALSATHACGITQAGGVRCWGQNPETTQGYVEVPIGEFPTDVPGLAGPVTQLAVGRTHACALIDDGRVQCWGNNVHSQLGDPSAARFPTSAVGSVPGLSAPAVQLASGHDHVCARLQGGAVQCWGHGGNGRIGNGATEETAPPATVSLPGAALAIAAGPRHSCAIVVGGTVRCWGDNSSGQLGDGSVAMRTEPVRVTALTEPARAIAAGSTHNCAVMESNRVRCWGDNGALQLGLADIYSTAQGQPVTGLPGVQILEVHAGSSNTCAVDAQRRAWCWGGDSAGYGELRLLRRAEELPFAGAVRSLSFGGGVLCVVGDDHRAQCAGYRGWGHLANGATANEPRPRRVPLSRPVVGISTGTSASCASDAQGRTQCWGSNEYYAVGDGTRAVRMRPVEVAGNLFEVRAGQFLSCGASPAGEGRCWGKDPGVLDFTLSERPLPTVIPGLESGVARVGGDATFACALRTSGALQCWGGNFRGSLGRGPLNAGVFPTPSNVDGMASGVTDFAVSGFFGCAVQSGDVKCWGQNDYGQLGANLPDASRDRPVRALLPTAAVAVRTARDGACALDVMGDVYCWGFNGGDMLGVDSDESLYLATPRKVDDLPLPATRLSMGGGHVCVLLTDQSVQCWGSNLNGELGRDTASATTPTPGAVVGLDAVIDVAAGPSMTCAVRADGDAFCWGLHANGRLGIGGVNESLLAPVLAPDPAHIFEGRFETE